MSEPRIAVKIVHGRFVTCYPMVDPRPDEITFPQRLAQNIYHCRPYDIDGTTLNYAITKEDQFS